MTYKKKLVEVALPLEAISASCKADKNRKTGTIRNLHKWFSPMPLPAWRALLFASLIDDPVDPEERARLLSIIEGLTPADGVIPSDRAVRAATTEIRRAWPDGAPTVVDPFCGGGSTLVEARRLGLRAVGSDLNPVPALVSRTLTELAPSVRGEGPYGASRAALAGTSGLSGFVADVEHYGQLVYAEAKRRIGAHYPTASDGSMVIAWRWARTVESPDPRFQGVHVPLVASWWMSKRKGERAHLRPVLDHAEKTISFEVVSDGDPVEPSNKRCLFSDAPIAFPYLRKEGKAGRLGDMMIAVAADSPGGRGYQAPNEEQLRAARSVEVDDALADVPLPDAGLGFRVQGYGVTRWRDLFTDRQLLALGTFAELVQWAHARALEDGADDGYATAVASVLGLCVGKMAQSSSRQVRWRLDSRNGAAKAEPAFARHDLALIWDFVEVNPFGGSVGDWMQQVETAVRAFEWVDHDGPASTVYATDARDLADRLDDEVLVATDPPYFAYIGYADLSDYFYVWLRHALAPIQPDLFSTIRAPRAGEVIADPSRHGGDADAAAEYFIDGLEAVFGKLATRQSADVPMLIVYAYRQAETGDDRKTGWEAVLEALMAAGLAVVGTWPIHGTGSSRQRGQNSNALATYALLVCRPRSAEAGVTSRREFQTGLRSEMAGAVAALTSTNIAPADLAQAAIGPGMAVFSRHSAVIEADGSHMTVRTALNLINRTLDEVLEERDSELDTETRWAVAWYEQAGLEAGEFGSAEALARAKVTSIDGLVEAGFLHARAGSVRLLTRDELADDWDPRTDARLTVWEVMQHLVRTLQRDGEEATGALIALVGGLAEVARDLAYRLYLLAEKKGWVDEAYAYNSLVAAWPELIALSREATTPAETQPTLDV